MAVTPRQKEAILTAIRVLRTRRVRPSGVKIAWYVRRENLLKEDTTNSIINELVKSGDIHKVDYKGAFSYRLANEIAPRSKYDGLCLRQALMNAVSLSPNGLTITQISGYLTCFGVEHTLDRISVILQRETRSGLLIKEARNADGRPGQEQTYFTPQHHMKIQNAASAPASPTDSDNPAAGDKHSRSNSFSHGTSVTSDCTPFEQLNRYFRQFKKQKETKKDSLKGGKSVKEMEYQRLLDEQSINEPSMLGRRGRPKKAITSEDISYNKRKKPRLPSQRMKRARKVFDPSQQNAKRRASISSDGFQPVSLQRCDVCYQSSAQGTEDLLVCHSCSAKAHPGCLGYNSELAVKSLLGPWTCMDCKHCAICNMDHNIGTLIFCDKCDRAYHLTCHHPPLDEQPHGSWICFGCDPNASRDGYEFLLGTPSSSPSLDEESRGSCSSGEVQSYDPQIPDASQWTVDHVMQHFKNKGFEKYCQVFKEQDIDGTALLMLTRMDVLTGLNVKLGPALKLYKQVRILQTRNANPPV